MSKVTNAIDAELGKILDRLGVGVGRDWLVPTRGDLAEAKAAINSLIEKAVMVARIDELQELQLNYFIADTTRKKLFDLRIEKRIAQLQDNQKGK